MSTSAELRVWVDANSALTGEDILDWMMSSISEDALVEALEDLKTAVEDGNY